MSGKTLAVVAAVVVLGGGVAALLQVRGRGAGTAERGAPSELGDFSLSARREVAGPTSAAPAAPGPAPSGAAAQAGGRRTYANQEYDFSFTYPTAFGEVVVAREPGSSDQPRQCRGVGERVRGSFTGNPDLDFGFVTGDYRDCSERPVSLFDVIGLEVRGSTLALATAGGAEAFELAIEEVLPTASPGVVAYVVENTIDGDRRGSLAAVVKSPIRKIGALVFRTRNLSPAAGLRLLEEVITR